MKPSSESGRDLTISGHVQGPKSASSIPSMKSTLVSPASIHTIVATELRRDVSCSSSQETSGSGDKGTGDLDIMRVAVSEPAVTVEVKDLGRLAAAILGQISLQRPRSAFKLDQ